MNVDGYLRPFTEHYTYSTWIPTLIRWLHYAKLSTKAPLANLAANESHASRRLGSFGAIPAISAEAAFDDFAGYPVPA